MLYNGVANSYYGEKTMPDTFETFDDNYDDTIILDDEFENFGGEFDPTVLLAA